MKKFHFKKSVSQEETPTLLRLERRHTLMSVAEDNSPADNPNMTVRSPTPECVELNKSNKLSQSSTDGYGMKRRIPAKSLSYDAKGSECSPASSVVITDSDLSSSWIYKSKKEAAAACNDVFESSPCDPKSPLLEPSTEFEKCKPRTPRTPRTPKTPKNRLAEKGYVVKPASKHPQTCSWCCCIFTVLLVFLCSIGIISAIGGILYLELYTRIKPTQHVDLASPLEDTSHGVNIIPASVFIKESNAIDSPHDQGEDPSKFKSEMSSVAEKDVLQHVNIGKLNSKEITAGSESNLNGKAEIKNRRGRILDEAGNDKALSTENDKEYQDNRNNLDFTEEQLSHLNIKDLAINSDNTLDGNVSYEKEAKSVNEKSSKMSENESLENKNIDISSTKQHQIPNLFLNKSPSLTDFEDGQPFMDTKHIHSDTSKTVSTSSSVEKNSSPSAMTTYSDSKSFDSSVISHPDKSVISISTTNAVSHPVANAISNSSRTAIVSNKAIGEITSNKDVGVVLNFESNGIDSKADTSTEISNADIREQDKNSNSNALASDSGSTVVNLDLEKSVYRDTNAVKTDFKSDKINDNLDYIMNPNTDTSDKTPDSIETTSELNSNIQSSNLQKDEVIGQPLTPNSDKLNVDKEKKSSNSQDISEPIVITSVAPMIPFEFFRRLEMEELPEAIAKSRGIIDMQSSLAEAVQKMQHLNPSNKYPLSRNKGNSPQRFKPQIVFSGPEANLERRLYKQRLRTLMYDNV